MGTTASRLRSSSVPAEARRATAEGLPAGSPPAAPEAALHGGSALAASDAALDANPAHSAAALHAFLEADVLDAPLPLLEARVLDGDAHVVLEFPLGNPLDPEEPGILARGNFGRDVYRAVLTREQLERRLTLSLAESDEDRNPGAPAIVRRYQLQARLDPDLRLWVVLASNVGVLRAPIEADKDEVCPICQFALADIPPVRLLSPCAHAYHAQCVDFYLVSAQRHGYPTCPLCKSVVEM